MRGVKRRLYLASISTATSTQRVFPTACPSVFSRAFPFWLLGERLKNKPALQKKEEKNSPEDGRGVWAFRTARQIHAESYSLLSTNVFSFCHSFFIWPARIFTASVNTKQHGEKRWKRTDNKPSTSCLYTMRFMVNAVDVVNLWKLCIKQTICAVYYLSTLTQTKHLLKKMTQCCSAKCVCCH